MHSLFSRSRTFSIPKKPASEAALDEFGRITSRGSGKGASSSTASKKDKKSKDKSKGKGTSSPATPEPPEFQVPDGSFLPLNLDPQRYEPGEEPPQERRQLHDYGYLSYKRHVVLGLDEVAKLVDVVGKELGTRGLTTPFIFSSLALDVSASAVRRLINAFLKTCGGLRQEEAERLWREEVKFAGPHALGMCLRWGLARLVRIVGGQEVRGLLSYQNYLEWSVAEAEQKYPPTFFGAFIAPLDPLLRQLLVGLLALLTKFTAHSSSSGHTPPTLSTLFGPLLFGLGPSTLAFHHAYLYYLRATIATEHLLLCFIRWQDVPDAEGSTATALGVPMRLKAWIQGYPAMLPKINPHERPQPRRGARTTRVVSVRRNVRMYSPDLVKTAASWGQRPRVPTSSSADRSFASSREWERICPPTLKLPPRYSDSYRKRMDLPASFHPETGAGSTAANITNAPSLSSSVSTSSTSSSLFEDKELGLLGSRTPENRFRSLTDMRWGEFEAMGFGDQGADDKKLQFDLTESARAARSAKRATLSWQDFSSAGFSRTDAPLHATLQFSAPVTQTVNTWPAQSAEIHRKLKKTQKALPAFGWDTEPVVGAEEVIEEGFIDVFCDLIYGGGWMDVERMEEVDRECNWVLVEFKSMPMSKPNTVAGSADPRTASTLVLFEEFVPLEYRQQLRESGGSRKRIPSLFGAASRKQWKPATTLNGRPYVVGHVPHSPSYREVEFEGLLSSNGSVTKVITLKTPDRQQGAPSNTSVLSPFSSTAASPITTHPSPHLFLTPTPQKETPIKRTSSRGSDAGAAGHSSTPNPTSPTSMTSSKKSSSRFRLPVSQSTRTSGLPPAEYDTIDFEARLASFDDEGANSRNRRRSRDDAWVDILVASNSRRLSAQDAPMRDVLRGGRSDPELASQEVSEVLAAVRGQLPLDDDDDDDDDGMEPVHESEHYDDASTSEADRDTLPRPQVLVEDEDDEPVIPQFPKRRLGYFDLHPERRPQRSLHDGESSPSPSPSPSLSPSPSPITQSRLNPEHYSPDDPRARFERHSLDISEESAYNDAGDEIEPRPQTPVAPLLPPKNGNGDYNEEGLSGYPSVLASTKPLSLPHVAVSPPAAESDPAKSQTSKTASLIEMYRERERQAVAAPVPPSKLPVRTGASLTPILTGRERSQSPRPHSPVGSASSATSVELEDALLEPRPLDHNDIGLMTPGRYVHGAPLHNVLEEPEEEFDA